MAVSVCRIAIAIAAVVVAATNAFAAEPAVDFSKQVRPILSKLCFECHGERSQKADLRVDQLNSDLVKGSDAETWHDVLNRVNLGEMPPPKSKQPTKAERQILVDWLTKELRRAALAKRSANGRVRLRRLTRYEYQNTMRDLLGVNLDFTTDLPPEPLSPDGFLNDGATLEMSPAQLEAYLDAARKGLAEAIVSGEKPKVSRIRAEKTAVGRLPNRPVAGHAPARPEFLVSLDPFPRRGEFEIRIRASAIVPEGGNFPQLQLALGCIPGIVHVPRKIVGTVDVTASDDVYFGGASASASISSATGGNFENLDVDSTAATTTITEVTDTTTVSLSATGSVVEGGTITYTATLTNAADGDVTVSLSNGATITIADGASTGTVDVTASADVYDGNDSASATIANSTAAIRLRLCRILTSQA